MSETIATIEPAAPPEGYDKLSRIEVIKGADDSEKLYGVINLAGEERKVQLPDLAAAWGYDPEERAKYQADPEKWDLYKRLQALENQVADLTSANQRLEAELGELKSSNLKPQSPAPGVEVERPADLQEEFAGFRIGDEVAIERSDGREDTGYEVIGFNQEDDKVIVKSNSGTVHLPVDPRRLKHQTAEPPPPSTVTQPGESRSRTSESRLQRGWHRLTGPIGNAVLMRQVKIQNGYYNLLDRRGRIVEEDVELIDGYPPESERAGAAVIGGTALVGAGVLLGYLIWGRHGANPPEIINHYHTQRVPVGSSGNHIDYLRPNGVSAAGLPAKLQVAKDFSGHEIIKNNLGQTVVSHAELPQGFQDRQGNFSRAARAVLRAKGYILTQTHVPRGGRYMTAVWNR